MVAGSGRAKLDEQIVDIAGRPPSRPNRALRHVLGVSGGGRAVMAVARALYKDDSQLARTL